jgi:hypothetical protein
MGVFLCIFGNFYVKIRNLGNVKMGNMQFSAFYALHKIFFFVVTYY